MKRHNPPSVFRALPLIVSMATVLNICLFTSAHAAADGVAIPKFIDITKEAARIDQVKSELNTKIDSEVAKLQAVDALLAELETLHTEISTLAGELDTAQSEAATQADSFAGLVNDGITVFNAQVASLLSPELAAQVSQELEQARQYIATGSMSDNKSVDLTGKMGSLDGSFSNFRSEVARIIGETKSLQEELISVRKENKNL